MTVSRRPLPPRRAALALLIVLAAPSARAADPPGYSVALTPTGTAALDQALTDSSTLIGLRTAAPTSGLPLLARARADLARLATVLVAYGYLDGQAIITIDGEPLDAPDLPDRLAGAAPAPASAPAKVAISARPGPLFALRRLTVSGADPVLTPTMEAAALAPLAPGQPALSADLFAARDRLLAALRAAGHPLASLADPVGRIVPGTHRLDVLWAATPGPHADLGPITLTGLSAVNPEAVRTRLTLRQGDPFDPARLDAARADLTATGLFTSVRMVPADQLDAAGQLPLGIDLAERPRHTIAANASYSSDIGGSLGLTWTDRNLFGGGEQLALTAAITQLAGTQTPVPGYDLAAGFTLPDWQARGQTMRTTLEALSEQLPAYARTAQLAGQTLARSFANHWTASLGLALETERVNQESVLAGYDIIGLPLALGFDNSNDKLNPTAGLRAGITATPSASIGPRTANFAILSAQASTYLDLGAWSGLAAPGRSVLALRGLVGAVPGVAVTDLPPDQRFYAGGGGSVRGFLYQSLGPRFADNNPIGGTSVATASVEWRQRVLADYGFAAFVDAGEVAARGVQATSRTGVGAGLGARYYTSFGPIRLDVAVPVNPRPGDGRFELYVGLGQAF